jgi:hypothetical protein
MCTTISATTPVKGSGKGPQGWFPLTQATVGFDHASHTGAGHALLIDFANYDLGTGARVAVELDLASGRALMDELRRTIEAAEASGLDE